MEDILDIEATYNFIHAMSVGILQGFLEIPGILTEITETRSHHYVVDSRGSHRTGCLCMHWNLTARRDDSRVWTRLHWFVALGLRAAEGF